MDRNRVLIFALGLTITVSFSSCSLYESYKYKSEKAIAEARIGDLDKTSFEGVVSCSPNGDTKLQLGKDNNLYLCHEKSRKIVYRNYEKDRELFKHPYSLWSFDFFRIQWSKDGQYAYIIDSIYDVANDKLIPLKDCLIFSWVGNKGVYLSGGKVVEGKFWDHGFYGLYVSKCMKVFEAGEVKMIKERNDDRYYVVEESSWSETEKTLFKCLNPDIEVKSAKFKFDEEKMYDKLIKAYQELRENEKVWEFLNSEYLEANSRDKAIDDFEALKAKHPVKLLDENFYGNRLNWDFDMDYYLVDVRSEKLS